MDIPRAGICGECGSEKLTFFEDGSGRCESCDRLFSWKEEDDEDIEKLDDEEEFLKNDLPSLRSRTNGFDPSRPPRAALQREKETGFLKIINSGFILLILGFIVFYGVLAVNSPLDISRDDAETVLIFSQMIKYVGVVLVGMGLVIGAVKGEHLDDNIRGYMVVSMAVLLGITLGLSIIFRNFLGPIL